MQFVVFNVIEDTGFYWIHRAFHHPKLYPLAAGHLYLTACHRRKWSVAPAPLTRRSDRMMMQVHPPTHTHPPSY